MGNHRGGSTVGGHLIFHTGNLDPTLLISKVEVAKTFAGIRNTNLIGGGEMRWGIANNTFSWTKAFDIMPGGGSLLVGGVSINKITIAAGSIALAAVNDVAYITIPTTDAATAVLTVCQYNAVPAGDNKLIIAWRDSDSCLEILGGGWLVYGTIVEAGGKRDNYVPKSIITAAGDFFVGSGNGAVVKKTLAETQALILSDANMGAIQRRDYKISRTLTTPAFTAAVANQKVKLNLGAFAVYGQIKITAAGSWNGYNSTGVLEKIFNVGMTAPGVISVQLTSYTNVDGYLKNSLNIGDIAWNGTSYEIVFSKLVTAADLSSLFITIEFIGSSLPTLAQVKAMSFGAVYTTDATVPAVPVLQSVGSAIVTAATANTVLTNFARTDAIPIFAGGVSGNEGGKIFLKKPPANSTLAADVKVDLNMNSIRFFEEGGSTRGAYIDLTTCAATIGSKIWHSTNHGAWSGMDSDYLHGIRGDQFVSSINTKKTWCSMIVKDNCDKTWGGANLQLQTTDNSAPSLGFHRSGVSACTLHEELGELWLRGNGEALSYKFFNERNYGKMIYISGSITLGYEHNHCTLVSISGANIVVTVPNLRNASDNFEVAFVNGSGGEIILAQSSSLILSKPDNTKKSTNGLYSIMYLRRTLGATEFYLFGDIKA